MQTFLAVVVFASSLVLILSVIFQEGRDAGMNSISGSQEKLFGKNSTKGFQAMLQRATIISSAVFMVVIFIMGAMFR